MPLIDLIGKYIYNEIIRVKFILKFNIFLIYIMYFAGYLLRYFFNTCYFFVLFIINFLKINYFLSIIERIEKNF